jgi:hypothetical protein
MIVAGLWIRIDLNLDKDPTF